VNEDQVIETIKRSIEESSRHERGVCIFLQIVKNADKLKHMSGSEFCRLVDIGETYRREFSLILKTSRRLQAAGLDPEKL
jgi:hypothetical protein